VPSVDPAVRSLCAGGRLGGRVPRGPVPSGETGLGLELRLGRGECRAGRVPSGDIGLGLGAAGAWVLAGPGL